MGHHTTVPTVSGLLYFWSQPGIPMIPNYLVMGRKLSNDELDINRRRQAALHCSALNHVYIITLHASNDVDVYDRIWRVLYVSLLYSGFTFTDVDNIY